MKVKKDTVTCQAFVRRFLATTWFARVRTARRTLEDNVDAIRELIHKYNMDAQEFKECFVNRSISGPFKHLATFEDYEISQTKQYPAGVTPDAGTLPKLQSAVDELKKLKKENAELQAKLAQTTAEHHGTEEEKEWKEKLGTRYEELPEMIQKLKVDLHRVTEEAKQSLPLPIKLQHQYQYRYYSLYGNTLLHIASGTRSTSPITWSKMC